MVDLSTSAQDTYIAEFAHFEASRTAHEPASLTALRRAALARFEALGFPTRREEAWRFTDISPLTRTAYTRALPAHNGVTADDLAAHVIPGSTCLVFVNGHSAPRLASGPALPDGVTVTSLAEALEGQPDVVLAHLGHHADFEAQAFVALNTAFVADGAFIHVPRGVVVHHPIQLLFVGRGHGAPLVSFPRTLILADEASQLTVVEQYLGLGTDYFTCAVTEIVVGPGAVVDHYKVQQEDVSASHMATQQVYQLGASSFASHAIQTGGGLVRNDVNAVLDGAGADCILNGLYMAHGQQHVDNHMLVHHVAPHCTSHELYKGILEDRARAVFNGRIYVHPGAQKTDAKQTNRNLLLSKEALVNSNPQLEIFADDVKCTHGSTVGQLDEAAVFYLRSRGIGLDAARSLLTYAFAADIVERIKVPAVRADLEEFLFRRLPQGDVVREAV